MSWHEVFLFCLGYYSNGLKSMVEFRKKDLVPKYDMPELKRTYETVCKAFSH